MITKKERIVLVTLFAVLSLSTLLMAGDCPIPDTGQTKCYSNDSEITCPSPGEPFYGQDAQYICNPQSYTSLADGDMVQDNVTGLVWENKTEDGSIHDKGNIYIWNDAQSIFITTLNKDNFGGYSDWRLPTVMELSFLVDRYSYDPSINTTYFPNTKSSYYWSSTNDADDPNYAWLVGFNGGGVGGGASKSGNQYVRAVRGEQCEPFDNFIDNGDGTVTNTDTGLMWQQDTAPTTYSWQEALYYCENLTLASHKDWRLPNINELQSLVDYTRYEPTINTDYFPNTVVSSPYWSSTTYVGFYDKDSAWVVSFSGGDVYVYGLGKSYYPTYVRAVRGGQCGSFDTSTTTTVASTTTTISGSTTSTISGSTTTTTIIAPCPTESLYGENSKQTELLRYLRDNILSTTPEGQEIIRLYYELSPVIIKMMEENEKFKAQVKEMIDGILQLIKGEVE